ncbi:MAG: hypothetical protein C0606_13580 [Hyphomicrobiales bacterium]|nr:MAG: hypothetical protein C0606_13580 [Hyphomicrobiales bacterium]
MTEPAPLHADTRAQIDAFTTSGRPLIVCDVDEVVLHFIAPLERHLDAYGYDLIARSYSLAGNVIHRESGAALPGPEVHALLHGFFAERIHEQPPVDGAAEALDALSADADIVMLTNMPGEYREERAAVLTRHGIPFPVITNTGTKGAAVAALAERSDGPVIFLDDSPANLRSVRDTAGDTRLVQFIADPRFLALAGDIDGIDLLTGVWSEAHRFIDTLLGGGKGR